MLSARLIRKIEDNAEELTRGAVADIQKNPHTPAYHRLEYDELHRRAYSVYHNLGHWIGEKNETKLEAAYGELGRTRRAEKTPLAEVVFALILLKEHLRDYVLKQSLSDSAVEVYQEEELNLLIDRFFDRAMYHTIRGYEAGGAKS